MLRQLVEFNMTQQPLCIVYLEIIVQFELKPRFIHLLPIFKGNAREDSQKHLQDFHFVCDGMRSHGVTEEQLNLKAFPFLLKNRAKYQLYYKPLGSITTQNGLKKQFLEKFILASRANNIQKEIYGIGQGFGEILFEYWERYKQLCTSFPHHQISNQLLIQYLYFGLLSHDWGMIDVAGGGALVDKTPAKAIKLISTMVENS